MTRRLLFLGWVLALPLAAAGAERRQAAPLADDPRVASALELARVWLEAQRAYARIPGVSAEIVHGQEVLWSGGFGASDVASGRPATAETIYSICSISKLFTSIAVMQLRDEGRLRLDEPIGRYLPWFHLEKTAGEGDITLEGLLTHASGLPQEPGIPYWSAPDFPFPTREEFIAAVGSQSELYSPETFFEYSNFGLTLAGEVVAAVSGEPYKNYVGARILEPLGLTDTLPGMPESERGKRLATGYSALDREGRRAPVPFFDAKGVTPAAGFSSTARDLGRFASWQFRLLDSGGFDVLKATTLREMYRIHWIDPDFDNTRGLGFKVWRSDSKTFVGHGGECPGFRTQILLMPEERTSTVFLANVLGIDAQEWAQGLYDIVAPAIRAAVREPGKGRTPDPGLRRYAGTYDGQPWEGEVAVLPWEDGLAVLELPTMEPAKKLIRLRKVGENTFRRIRKDEKLGEELVFEMGPDGRPVRLVWNSNYQPRIR
jgi:CubicO group peptidase (beta-lactamase class C family)